MEEDNIIKKKKKNYYRHHRNQNNRNYYYKNKKKKNLILDNNDSEEVKNILLFNEEEKEESKVTEDTPMVYVSQEIPVNEVKEILKENIPDYEEIDVVPKKKESGINKIINNVFNKNILKYGTGFAVLLIALLGVSYSYFNYTKIDERQADIASGEVYVKLVENATSITLNKMYPRTDEEARSRNDNYFDFTIKGKNTSEMKSILYTLSINDGEAVNGKTRINPKYVKIDLQEKISGEYVYIQKGVTLDNYNFTGAILTNTENEITREYRLRIWIGDNVIISDTLPNASYTQSEFSNLFATFDITVNSQDKAMAFDMLSKNADRVTTIDFGQTSSDSNGKGLYLLSGTSSDRFPIYYYRGDVNNNNVIFGGYCWQMVRTTDTGGIKMIYNGEATEDGTTCENTVHADRIITTDNYNSSSNSVADVGYMSNKKYDRVSGAAASNSIFGKDVEWDGTKYLVIENTPGVASTNKTLDSAHHYTCGTSGTSSCSSVRYYFYMGNSNYYYIILTNGDNIEDALYKMTGNGSDAVKEKNAGYNLNTTDSTIKLAVENWFKENLTNEVNVNNVDYGIYLEDTVYCNDRSYKTTGSSGTFALSGWNSNGTDLTGYLYFGAGNRFNNAWYSTTNVPSMSCPNITDSFSVSNEKAKLKYSVGLLTVDEIILAGADGTGITNNSDYYLYTGDAYWSMTPNDFLTNNPFVYYVDGNHLGVQHYIGYSYGIRPVISLKLGTEFETTGDGTPTNPYVVKYEPQR